MITRPIAPLLVLASVWGGAACLPATSKDAFVGDRESIICEGVFNICRGKRASCRLEEDSFIEGSFPGTRSFMVETPPGTWNVKISLFLDPTVQPRGPGTGTDIFWHEPGCVQVYHYQLPTEQDPENLFEKAGRDNVLVAEQVVRKTGDHLIEVSSNAVTEYVLRADVDPLDE